MYKPLIQGFLALSWKHQRKEWLLIWGWDKYCGLFFGTQKESKPLCSKRGSWEGISDQGNPEYQEKASSSLLQRAEIAEVEPDWQTVLMELWEPQDKHQIPLTTDRVGFRSDWSLAFQRSDGTSNVDEADLFDFSASYWAACWLCFYGIGVFDSTFSTPPRLPPPPANVFSHSICSTVTGGVMPLPFLLLVRRLTRSVDKWNYRPWKCNVYAEQIQ